MRLIEFEARLGETHGPLTGDDEVEVVPTAPTGFVREVDRLSVYNADTAAVEVSLILVEEAGPTPTLIETVLALAAKGKYDFADRIRPLYVPEGFHLEMVMAADPATTQPNWVSAYTDRPLSAI